MEPLQPPRCRRVARSPAPTSTPTRSCRRATCRSRAPTISATYLFRDLRFLPDGSENPDFLLNQPAYRDCAHRRRRAQLRLRFVARARGVGARTTTAFASPSRRASATSSRRTRSRTACCRCVLPRRTWSTGCWHSSRRVPGAHACRSTSSRRQVARPAGAVHRFDIDPVRQATACSKGSTRSATRCRYCPRSTPSKRASSSAHDCEGHRQ